MGFPEQPDEFKLIPLEERLVTLGIPFMQIRDLPTDHEKMVWGNIVSVPVDVVCTVNILPKNMRDTETIAVKFGMVWGNIVSVPVDVACTVNTLPKNMRDTETIAVKFKRKKECKHCEFKENVRPWQ